MRIFQRTFSGTTTTKLTKRHTNFMKRTDDIGLGAFTNRHLRTGDQRTFKLASELFTEWLDLGTNIFSESLTLFGLTGVANLG